MLQKRPCEIGPRYAPRRALVPPCVRGCCERGQIVHHEEFPKIATSIAVAGRSQGALPPSETPSALAPGWFRLARRNRLGLPAMGYSLSRVSSQHTTRSEERHHQASLKQKLGLTIKRQLEGQGFVTSFDDGWPLSPGCISPLCCTTKRAACMGHVDSGKAVTCTMCISSG